jgi:cyclomaltodextrinase
MTPKKLLLLSLTASIFIVSACSNNESSSKTVEVKNTNQTAGVNSFTALEEESTQIILADFFKDYQSVDSVSCPNGLKCELNNGILHLTGGISTPADFVKVYLKNECFLLPVKAYAKVPITLSYFGNGKTVAAAGEFNAWNAADGRFTRKEKNLWELNLKLNPGTYNYQLEIDGERTIDPENPLKVDNGQGGFNSQIVINRTPASEIPQLTSKQIKGKTLEISTSTPAKGFLISFANHPINEENISYHENNLKITLPDWAKNFDYNHLSVFAYNEKGLSNQILVPVVKGEPITSPHKLPRHDKFAQSLYFLMVDRFKDGNPDNNKPINSPEVHPRADYQGGDLEGVIAKIDDGYFESLGIKTIWLSPITQNPEEAFGLWPSPRTKFSGYHGYWPITLTTVDYRFGSRQILDNLVNKAHTNKMNVLLDYVANHVHEQHPIVQQNPDWTTPLYLEDGSLNTERWDDYRLTTWFDTFMPTLDLERPEVYEPMSDSALFWAKEAKLDGYRHDATKHIPTVFWRTLTRKLKEQVIFAENRPIYQIGETYGSRELISSYIGSGLLDAQFDFNLYDDAIQTFARPEVSTERLINSLQESFTWYGNLHSMGNITGNQDRARFISYAAGDVSFEEDAKKAGWTRKIGIKDSSAYKNLALLHAFNYAIPGVPVLYYGDEIGLSGGNDPDNRKMMKFGGLVQQEADLLAQVKRLGNLRNEKMALSYGDTHFFAPNKNTLVVARNYFGEWVITLINKGVEPIDLTIDLTFFDSEQNLFNNVFSKDSYEINNKKLQVSLEGISYLVLTNN